MGSTPTTSKTPMAADDLYTGDIDPEIANLLGTDAAPGGSPDFDDLFEEETPSGDGSDGPAEDLSRESFPSIETYERNPIPNFGGKDFYRNVLTQAGEASHRVHRILQKYLKCEDPQERGVYRQQLIPAYWDLARSLSTTYLGPVKDKRFALRFGLLLPTIISPTQRDMLSRVVDDDRYGEPIYYVDEWLDKVRAGDVNPLATDELRTSRMSAQTKMKAQMEKTKGDKDANFTIIRNLILTREGMEHDLLSRANMLIHHDVHPRFPDIKLPYSPSQIGELQRMMDIIRKLSKTDKELKANLDRLSDADSTLDKLGRRMDEYGPESKVEKGTIENEMDSIRQMHKMCVGRQGNHLPFLLKNFFFPNIDLIATRENVIRFMDQVEQVDPGVFRRTFRQKTNRIVPHTIIIPCYGDKGICWEPFERFNRATSRGRIAIPMYPKNIKLAIIYALGDLRWHVAKEKAQHYWMEEGLTGHYYQWFNSKKYRGDVRLRFLEDYVLWITKESEAVQKLDKEVRGVFWRNMPFPQPLKDTLRNRGFVYNELYKKDVNRSLSDGY